MYKNIKGMNDILPKDVYKWQFIEEKARDVFKKFNYKEIRTPVLEYTELFQRGVGNNTDIVSKEMYTFNDRNNKSLSLRPEGTASVVRAYIQSKAYNEFPINKYYYIMSMYRHERPQTGRYREFHQIGAEFFGASSPASDYELLQLIKDFLDEIKVRNYKFHINSIGCDKCRPQYQERLIKELTPKKEDFCNDCKIRIQKNPLRILDCKVDSCINLTKNIVTIDECLCEECKKHQEELIELLDNSNIEYIIDNKVVRGLDYYVRTTFEVKVDKKKLGSQNTIVGGGRYSKLVKQLSGPDTNAIGFGMGLERLILAMDYDFEVENIDYFIIPLGKEAINIAMKIAKNLRNNYSVDMDYRFGSLKSQMRYANKQNSKKVIIIGENEIKNNVYIEKNMINSTQEEKKLSNILNI